MPSSWDVVKSSLDGRTDAVLRYVDEVRFGPAYFTLWLGVEERTPGTSVYFGRFLELSSDGRFVVVERWDDLRVPNTTAVIVDCVERRIASLLHMGRGHIERVSFRDSGVVILHRDFDGTSWSNVVDEVDT